MGVNGSVKSGPFGGIYYRDIVPDQRRERECDLHTVEIQNRDDRAVLLDKWKTGANHITIRGIQCWDIFSYPSSIYRSIRELC